MTEARDARAGLVAPIEAIEATLPGVGWQRRRTHYAANLMWVNPEEQLGGWVKALLLELRPARPRGGARPVRPRRLATAGSFSVMASSTSRPPTLTSWASPRSPKEIWRQVWSHNPNERLNLEIRR